MKQSLKSLRLESLYDTGINRQVLCEIVELAKKNGMKQVILFGSRARGDFKRTSDIDLAVRGKNVPGFAADVDEETSTLLMFDIVDLEREIQEALRESIEREGRVIYEKI